MSYDVIYADYPWPFRVWDRDTGHGRSAEAHYSTMTAEELCAVPLPEWAAPDCAVFLWCVWPSILEYVPMLLEAWNSGRPKKERFIYKTCAFLWVKARKSGLGFHFGMGYYTRANTEPCLLFMRGNMPVAVHDVPQIVYSPVRAHSQKPDEVHKQIERLYPGKRYLEMFARKKTYENWHYWGNEIESDIAFTTQTKE